MINLLLGAPGGGKSYEAVAYHVLPAVQSGRKVITNLPLYVDVFAAIVPGCENLIEIRTETKGIKPEPQIKNVFGREVDVSGASTWSNRPFAHVEDYQDEWRDENGRGPLYVIDECHFCLPLGKTDTAVEEWYSMHRHYNVDVLLITQSYGKCSRAIIDLVQVCYKVRKAIAFGKSDGYFRKVLDGPRGGEISVQQRKYDSKFFKLYRSHTHGTALDEKDPDDVSPLIVKYRRFTRFVWFLSFFAFIYAFWPSDGKKPENTLKPKKASESVSMISDDLSDEMVYRKNDQYPDDESAKSVEQENENKELEIEQLKGKRMHVTGSMEMGSKRLITFTVSDSSSRIFDLTSDDLEAMGYKVRMLSSCIVMLEMNGRSTPVVCDAPYMQPGTQDKPVVYDSFNGRWSNERQQ